MVSNLYSTPRALPTTRLHVEPVPVPIPVVLLLYPDTHGLLRIQSHIHTTNMTQHTTKGPRLV